MGHYVSEMESDRETEARLKRDREWFDGRKKNIQTLIDKHGLTHVLTMMVEDPIGFRINTCP